MFWEEKADRENHLVVCEHCLWGIESHEGSQIVRRLFVDETDEKESECMWCHENGFDELFEIL